MKRIVIIGGGLSGALTALSLGSGRDERLQIMIIEKNDAQLFKGLAYSSDLNHQPLNVPASGMSLLIDEPDHFLKWLNQNTHITGLSAGEITPDTFISRKVFGAYLSETISVALKASHHEIALIQDEAVAVQKEQNNYTLKLASGKLIEANKIIIATGNQDTDFPYSVDPILKENGNLISNPWAKHIIESIDAKAPILIIGAGLTMVDLLINLRQNNHTGKITIVSRRGFLPLPHKMGQHWQLKTKQPEKINLKNILQFVHHEVELAKAANIGWQSVIDAIRPYLPQWWRGLTLSERTRLMRHLKPYWEIHRHRIPVDSHNFIQRELAAGTTALYGGKIIHIAAGQDNMADVSFSCRKTNEQKQFHVKHIINCIGPLTDLKKSKLPLWQNLLQSGMVDTDYFNSGISCNAKGHIIDTKGQPDSNIFVIGNLRKGAEFESVAIRELRIQAKDIADQIQNEIKPKKRRNLFEWIID